MAGPPFLGPGPSTALRVGGSGNGVSRCSAVRLCAAIVDRLTFNGAIIQTGTESYRLAHTKAQAE